jgi:thymidine phosphorylase
MVVSRTRTPGTGAADMTQTTSKPDARLGTDLQLAANALRLKRLGIDTHQEAVIYMREDCPICRAEGFAGQTRIRVENAAGTILVATLNLVTTDLLARGEAGLSEIAWSSLEAHENDLIRVSHPRPVESLGRLRSKIFGGDLDEHDLTAIVTDIRAGRYSDIELSAFVTACTAHALSLEETVALTRAMVASGEKLDWGHRPIVDKHCVGGLPGNRTTPIVVAIVTAAGLTMPKTSSRAITSPAGTADVMETLAPVALDLATMRRVVDDVGGCIAWGGSVNLSPVDDVLIRVERALNIDGDGQLVASVLSKKVAAGSTHLVLDIPVGPTAKVRDAAHAERLRQLLSSVAALVGLNVRIRLTDGQQPVGHGIGPALEARDVLAVLQRQPSAPSDLAERALQLAGDLLELSETTAQGSGYARAQGLLADGRAWQAFQKICEAQGGMRTPPKAAQRHPVFSPRNGFLTGIDNRRLAKIAKLAGAPFEPAAGLDLHVRLGSRVSTDSPLFTLHAQSVGERDYALEYLEEYPDIFTIEDEACAP